MVEVLIAEMFGSDRIHPTDYQRAVVVDARGSKETRKTTLRSEWRSALKKNLTEPALLEMSGKATHRPLAARGGRASSSSLPRN